MAQRASRIKLTYQDLAHFPEDGQRHELVDGEHFVTASPSIRHQRILTRLLVGLDSHLRAGGLGEVFPAPSDVVLSEFDVVVPDLLVMTPATSRRVTEANIQGSPDLVVEILSPSTADRDRDLKRKLYEKFGVREYWMVDPAAETIQVLSLRSGTLVPADPLARTDTLTSPLFPGLEIPLSAVFED